MDLALSDDQAALTDAFGAFFTKESTPTVVRAAEPLGFDTDLWSQLVEMGVPSMATPETAGGGGASLLDVALVAELAGRHLAPVPLVETVVAARLLARAGSADWLDRAHEGAIVTLAVGGPVVPAGAIAEAVIALDGDRLVVAPLASPLPALSNVGGIPLAAASAVDLTGASVIATGDDAATLHRLALDEWRALAAAVLVGMARAALEIGVDYTKSRHQFDRPIASFQSIAHRLADDATAAQGAMLLARKAAWTIDEEPDDGARLASMAYLYAGEVANRIAQESLHFHGGYGFMLEYDIQLYFRRAKAWSIALGDPGRSYARLGRELVS